jgi:hypothetical protein
MSSAILSHCLMDSAILCGANSWLSLFLGIDLEKILGAPKFAEQLNEAMSIHVRK